MPARWTTTWPRCSKCTAPGSPAALCAHPGAPWRTDVTDPPAPDELLVRLAANLADQIAQRYRIDPADALALILADWQGQPRLVAAAAGAAAPRGVLRLRIYRDAAAAAKRDIYYRLRRYRAAETAFDDAVRALAGLVPGCPPHL